MTQFRTVVADPPWQFENRASRVDVCAFYPSSTVGMRLRTCSV